MHLHSLAGLLFYKAHLDKLPHYYFPFCAMTANTLPKLSTMNPSARLAQSVERETLNLKVAGECKDLRKNVSRTK